jgi:hypothetical protein
MGLVRGEDVILSIAEYQENVGYVYLPIGCARSITFDISTDFIETSVTESGAFKTFIPSGKQYTGNIEGLVFLDKPKVNEVNATATVAYNPAYAPFFPNDGTTAVVTVDDPDDGSIIICSVISAFTNYEDLVDAMVTDINANAYNYSAVKQVIAGGFNIVITARPGLGSTMVGLCSTVFNFDGTIFYNNTYFSGGVDSYFPAKYNMGLMYSKIVSGEILGLKYYETDDDNHYLQKQCEVYIESINETASFDNIVTFTASFKGTGQPTITYGEI